MGQQASSEELLPDPTAGIPGTRDPDADAESSRRVTAAAWCGPPSTAMEPLKEIGMHPIDTVRSDPFEEDEDGVQKDAPHSGRPSAIQVATAPSVTTVSKPQRPPPSSGFGCGIGLPSGPKVEVVNIEPRRATVRWIFPAGQATKFHIDVLRLASVCGAGRSHGDGGMEIGFFEAPGDASELQLPEGVLERASGLFRVQVMAETGTADRPRLTSPGLSAPFFTPPEPPGPVHGPELDGLPHENQICIRWQPPADDGGSAIEEYEVTIFSPDVCTDTPASGQEAPPEECAAGHADEKALIFDLQGSSSDQAASRQVSPTEEGAADKADDKASFGPKAESSGQPALHHKALADACSLIDADCKANSKDANDDAKRPQVPPKQWRTAQCSFSHTGLLPGSGPYRIEVRALSTAGLAGAMAFMEASTAVAAPSAISGLRARLRPGRLHGAEGDGKSDLVTADMKTEDRDVVRLEFRGPRDDGGRKIESFLVYAVEETFVDDMPEAVKQGKDPVPLCDVAVADAVSGGKLEPGGVCACLVNVEPNKEYTFFVEAHNGVHPSPLSDPSASVFVPARVPGPPREPPEVFRVEGGFAAELRWVGPLRGGGLPLLSFKVGILGPGDMTQGAQTSGASVAREVTISCSEAMVAAQDSSSAVRWQPPVPVSDTEAVYAARVDGLQADARYCFVLAASNALGTGRWSRPSSPLMTPLAAPPAVANAVATVMHDDKSQVVVTVSWDGGRNSGSCGAIAAFNVLLVPVPPLGTPTSFAAAAAAACSAGSSGSSCSPAELTVIRERVVVPSGKVQGRRFTWAAPLVAPGGYAIEIVAESVAGQRGPPVVLTLEVRPEAFPMLDVSKSQTPQWADEPVLVLGPAVSAEDTRFGEFEESGSWMQALLLWHDDDPAHKTAAQAGSLSRHVSGKLESGIDVICNYRRPGSSTSHTAVLAAGVTHSRLQVALPANIPMSLRLVLRKEPLDLTVAAKASVTMSAKVQSEPLLLMMSATQEHLKPTWEVWARQTVGGVPPRWTELPELINNILETAWLEDGNMAKVQFELADRNVGEEGGGCLLPPGHYEITFGDERQIQTSVRRLGMGGWSAMVRRSVRDTAGEDAEAPAVAAEDMCVVCMERRRTHAFMHADTGDGHLAVCGDCAGAYRAEAAANGASRTVRTCPMCRKNFSAVQRIYQ